MLYPASMPVRLHIVGSPGTLASIYKNLFRSRFVTTERQSKTIKSAQLSPRNVVHGYARHYWHRDILSCRQVSCTLSTKEVPEPTAQLRICYLSPVHLTGGIG